MIHPHRTTHSTHTTSSNGPWNHRYSWKKWGVYQETESPLKSPFPQTYGKLKDRRPTFGENHQVRTLRLKRCHYPIQKQTCNTIIKGTAQPWVFFPHDRRSVNVSTAINNPHKYRFLGIAPWHPGLGPFAEEPPLASSQTQVCIHGSYQELLNRREAGQEWGVGCFIGGYLLVAQVISEVNKSLFRRSKGAIYSEHSPSL